MNNIELKNKLVDLVNNHATVYAYGCFGNKLTENLINTKSKQYSWWYTSSKKAELIKKTKLGYVVWGFDCVNMIKGILWGWKADTSKSFGGAVYGSNGVPDINADTMITECKNLSTNFNSIEIGEAVWLKGHIGIYIGNGQVVECTPAWKNKVQITKLSQRKWVKHGKLPYITYSHSNDNNVNNNFADSSNFFGSKGYFSTGDNHENIGKIANFMYKTFPAYTDERALGNYYGQYIKASIQEFQLRAKAEGNYNAEVDGYVGSITLASLKKYGFKE